jgi:hypothetical protein
MTRALAAARVASEHAELWPAAALAAVSAIGWLPFVLAIGSLPSDSDLAFFASSAVLSPSFPLNVVLPVAAGISLLLSASVLKATGDTIMQRGIGRLTGLPAPERSLDEEAARRWVVQLVAALPVLLMGLVLLVVVAGVAPGEYQSPDLGQGPFLVRLVRDVWPLLALEAIAVVIGQAFATGAVRAGLDRQRDGVARAVAAGVRGLLQHPVRRLGITIVVDLVSGGWLLVTWALLRVLWAPIGRQAGNGALLEPGSLALLVGFVAIWLCLVAGGGVIRAWATTWWTLELDNGRDQWS